MSLCVVAALAAAVLASACGSSSTPSTPTTTPVQITEQFVETLTVNGAQTYPFVVQQTGTISATVTSLSPDSTVTIGLAIGTWNGSSCALTIVNNAAVLNTSVLGNANGTGNFCVHVYDPAGKLPGPTDFNVTISHY